MKKRIIAIILSITMAVTISSILAFAGETPTVEELLERIEALEERVTALELGSSAELSSEQIIEDLTTFAWEGTSEGIDGRFVFYSDNNGSMVTISPEGETEETPIKWVLKGKSIGFQLKDNSSDLYWFEYNNESGSPILIYDGEKGSSMILTSTEK